jgi:hypothetical protein
MRWRRWWSREAKALAEERWRHNLRHKRQYNARTRGAQQVGGATRGRGMGGWEAVALPEAA